METAAANVIKRAIRFHRDRICSIAARGTSVSRDVWIAMRCLYAYTDDVSGCYTAMGVGYELLYYDGPEIAKPAGLEPKGALRWITQARPDVERAYIPVRYKPYKEFLARRS